MGRRIKLTAVIGSVLAALLFTGIAKAQNADQGQSARTAQVPHNATGITMLEQRTQKQGTLINQRIEEISAVGNDLEEAQAQANSAQAQAEELEVQSRDLEGELAARQESMKSSEAAYEEMVRAAYKGDEIETLTSFLGGLFGGGSSATVADARASEVLFDGRESIEEYRQSQQYLRDTVRQFDQSRNEMREARREQEARAEDLGRREARLDEAISLLRVEKKRTRTRLQQLREEERAEILARDPASGGVRIQASREREIAHESIVARPVEEISKRAYLRLYRKAARDYGFAGDWYILAAVGKVESDHGENMGPSSSGALGPMQFLPSTWQFAEVDGNDDGVENVMDPKDAIPAAAKYLEDGGAPEDWYAALYSYNHADWYVKEVLSVAEGYRQLAKDDRVGPYTRIEPAE